MLTVVRDTIAGMQVKVLLVIGNINDFKDADKLAAYVGMVPRVSQSNETDNRGRITKRRNKLVRTTLVQCTLIAIRYSGYLNAFYRRIKDRRGASKTIIATARKLLAIIYQTLKTAGSSRTSQPSKDNRDLFQLDNHHMLLNVEFRVGL